MYSVSASKLSTLLVLPVVLLALMTLSTPVLAQSTFGSFVGTVSDPSGAVVRSVRHPHRRGNLRPEEDGHGR